MAFPSDYFAARDAFRQATGSSDWRQDEYVFAAAGPGGESLTLDVARRARRPGAPALVVSSGLHGVEGFFGSAVQLALIAQYSSGGSASDAAAGSSPDVNLVLVHALNPWGFAWRRRFNEDNVDPNRNFLPPGESFAGSPLDYGRFDRLLNPRKPPAQFDPFLPRAAWHVARRGVRALAQAVTSGQYDYPQGLFFGGSRPTQTQRIVDAHLDEWVGGARRVVHLDFHTGLGRWGQGKLLLDVPLPPERATKLRQAFGESAVGEHRSGDVLYTARGSFGAWCTARMEGREYTALCAEFGTYSGLSVVAGLRAENQAHHWGRADSPAVERAKRRLVELFCPRSPSWRRQALARGVEMCRQAEALLRD